MSGTPNSSIKASLSASFERRGRPSFEASSSPSVVFPLPGGPLTTTNSGSPLGPWDTRQVSHLYGARDTVQDDLGEYARRTHSRGTLRLPFKQQTSCLQVHHHAPRCLYSKCRLFAPGRDGFWVSQSAGSAAMWINI